MNLGLNFHLAQDEFDMDNAKEVYEFYTQRVKRRIEILNDEVKTHSHGLKSDVVMKEDAKEQDESESYHPSQDSEMTDQEHEAPQSRESTSDEQKRFDESLHRAQTTGSVVLEQFDFSDTKRVLKERLINYKQAIEYCRHIGQKKDLVKDLLTKAELIKQFIDTYDKITEDNQLDLIFKLPRDITPEDVLGESKKPEFLKYVQYIEKLIPTIQKERVRNMNIFKKQKDPISKENYQKLTKLVEEQEEIKEKLMELAGNRWQPLPEIHVAETHFPNSEDSGKSNGK